MKQTNFLYSMHILGFALLLALVGTMFYGYTVNVVLNNKMIYKTSLDGKKSLSSFGSNASEEEMPSEHKSNYFCSTSELIIKPIEPKKCYYSFDYKNTFKPKVVAPPPDFSLLFV